MGIEIEIGIGDWGLEIGIGDWDSGIEIGDWAILSKVEFPVG